MNKKIYLIAYTNLNFGDDLFIKLICDRYPTIQFFLCSYQKENSCYKEISNLKYIKIPLIFKVSDYMLKRLALKYSLEELFVQKYIKNCDAIVHIGGSIFMQHSKKVLWEWETHNNQLRLKYQLPIFVIGSNFGPYSDRQFYLNYQTIFSQFTDVCFREQFSYDLFSNLENVRLAPDIVFGLPVDKTDNMNLSPKKIVVSVIDLKHKERTKLAKFIDSYENKIIEIVNYFSARGYEVVLAGFCVNQQDDQCIDRIIAKMDTSVVNVQAMNYLGTLSEMISLYEEAELVISSRFHSMILALVLNKKNFSLVYSEKVSNVLNDLSLQNSYCTIEELNNLDVKKIESYAKKLQKEKLADVQKHAQEQFLGLDNWLGLMDGERN